MQSISLIRNRNQLTIPQSICQIADWVEVDAAVSLEALSRDEIVIRPHRHKNTKEMIWQKIKKVRSYKSAADSMSAVELLEKDRHAH